MKKITSDNKYFAILKKITQDSGRHHTNYSTSKPKPSQTNEEKKDYEMVDSSGGTKDNLLDLSTIQKSNQRMYGTEKIDMKKYNNLISQGPIMIDGEKEDSENSDQLTETKIEYPLQPGKALKLFSNKLTEYEKSEILEYKHIYFLGMGSEKIDGSPLDDFNYGFDDERGDYNVKFGDHVAFRFELIEFLGKGSFGQAVK
jgi:dual specificity tyrosine-phosphorylation-regulated kinase 2/3/4